MAGTLNKVALLGNLTRDPEVRQGPDGGKIVTFSVATSEQWRDKTTGERKEKPEFHRVVVFNENLASVAERFLKKGRKVYLEGQLQTRKWTDNQTGQEKYLTEVVIQRYRGEMVLCDGRNSESGYGGEGTSDIGNETSATVIPFETQGSLAKDLRPIDDFDDDIPF